MSFSVVLGFWSVETAIVRERVRHRVEEEEEAEEEKRLRRVSPAPAIPEAAISDMIRLSKSLFLSLYTLILIQTMPFN